MADFDRLTTLMERFALEVVPAHKTDASLVVTASCDGEPNCVILRPHGEGFGDFREPTVFCAKVVWGAGSNPLLDALPSQSIFDLQQDEDTRRLIQLMRSELDGGRCGSTSVVNRLGEVLIVRLLRAQIEVGATQAGLLAGLSDARLSRSIVAIHDNPGRKWRNEDLASIAGLSMSRFASLFLSMVGESPASYLRRWRLVLARQDVTRGDRIDAIARRYGYSSPEGFARAFKKQFGSKPIDLRGR